MSGFFTDLGSTIGGMLWFSLFLGVAFLFGLLGRTIRSGVAYKSAVSESVKQLQQQGKAVNYNAVQRIRRQGNSRIFMGIAGIAMLSYGILQFLPFSLGILIEALFLVAVLLGYFGIFIVPEGLGGD